MLTLTCCPDHILTENIWFVCSETSYSGDERRCYRCGTNEQTTTNSEDRATQPMEAGGWVSQWRPRVVVQTWNLLSWLGVLAATFLCWDGILGVFDILYHIMEYLISECFTLYQVSNKMWKLVLTFSGKTFIKAVPFAFYMEKVCRLEKVHFCR